VYATVGIVLCDRSKSRSLALHWPSRHSNRQHCFLRKFAGSPLTAADTADFWQSTFSSDGSQAARRLLPRPQPTLEGDIHHILAARPPDVDTGRSDQGQSTVA
jgi:hypothetical protein